MGRRMLALLTTVIFTFCIEQVTGSCLQLNAEHWIDFPVTRNVSVCGNWTAELHKTDEFGTKLAHIATCVNKTFCNFTDPQWLRHSISPGVKFRVSVNNDTRQAGYYRLDTSCDGNTSLTNETVCIAGFPTRPIISRYTGNVKSLSLVCNSNSTTEPPASRLGLTYEWRVGNWSRENCTASINASGNILHLLDICWGANITVTCIVTEDSLSVNGSIIAIAEQQRALSRYKLGGDAEPTEISQQPSCPVCERSNSDDTQSQVNMQQDYAEVFDVTIPRTVTTPQVHGVSIPDRRRSGGLNGSATTNHGSVHTRNNTSSEADSNLYNANVSDTQNSTKSTQNEATQEERSQAEGNSDFTRLDYDINTPVNESPKGGNSLYDECLLMDNGVYER